MMSDERDSRAGLLKRVLACAERACLGSSAGETLECVTTVVKEALGARSVALVVLDREHDGLSVASAQGLSKQFVQTYRRGVGTGTLGEVIWNDRKVLCEGLEREGAEYEDLKMEMDYASVACVRVAQAGRPAGFLWADSEASGTFREEDLVTMRVLAALAALALEREETQAVLRSGGAGAKGGGPGSSYGYFHRRLTEEMERAQRLNERTSLLLVSWDGSRERSGGEAFVEELMGRVRAMMRSIDVIGRYGSGQLVLYLPETNQESAMKAAERIRTMAEQLGEPDGASRGTVSIGVATFPENGETVEQLMNALTSALFRAQRAGGNRVSGPAQMYVS